jgi:hypothetical protein
MIDVATLINIGILLAGVGAVLAPYHMDTRRRAMSLCRAVERIERKLELHDRRTRKLRRRIKELQNVKEKRMENTAGSSLQRRQAPAR